jgi:hypothetical protein
MATLDSEQSTGLSRRNFFRSFLGQIISLEEVVRGIPQYNLNDLGNLPDSDLSQIKPMVRPSVEIRTENDHVNGRLKGKQEIFFIFKSELENTILFSQINGQNTIGQISEKLAKILSWEEEAAFSHTKNFFLKLVRLQVCVPANAIEQGRIVAP